VAGFHSQSRTMQLIRRTGWLRGVVDRVMRTRARGLFDSWISHLPKGSSVLDVGCGMGHIVQYLADAGFVVSGLDIVDLRLADVSLVVGDASKLPFRSGSFDYLCLCTVLHHIPGEKHHAILREAGRVARRGVILVEDVYRSKSELLRTKLFDRLLNMEFGAHPHANRTTDEWQKLLSDTGLSCEYAHEWVHWRGPFPIRHAVIIGLSQRGTD